MSFHYINPLICAFLFALASLSLKGALLLFAAICLVVFENLVSL